MKIVTYYHCQYMKKDNKGNNFMNIYIKIFNKKNSMKKRIQELEEENNELKYRPEGIGYYEALNDFTQLSHN